MPTPEERAKRILEQWTISGLELQLEDVIAATIRSAEAAVRGEERSKCIRGLERCRDIAEPRVAGFHSDLYHGLTEGIRAIRALAGEEKETTK